jgi:hypothetical protein
MDSIVNGRESIGTGGDLRGLGVRIAGVKRVATGGVFGQEREIHKMATM